MSYKILRKSWIIPIAASLIIHTTIAAVSPDQTLVEKVIRDNRYFIEFANVSVSNFGTPENEKALKEANQRFFNAHLFYLESKYPESFKAVRLSQEILLDLLYDILNKRLIEDARALLDLNAPIIIQSKDKKSSFYLQLGYRDVEVARQFRDMGYNYNRFLFSNKIRYYIDGIKRARRAKRYAFLALIESKTPMEDKIEYKTQTWDEARNVDPVEKIRDYERIKNNLTNQINRKLYTDTYNFFLHNDDNYGLISAQKTSVLKDAFKELQTKRPEKKKIDPDYPTNDQPEPKKNATPNAPDSSTPPQDANAPKNKGG